MKLLILICTLTGLGWLNIDAPCTSTERAAIPSECTPADCDPSECEIEAECTPDGTCIVTCTDPAGRTCTVEVDCAEVDCDPADCDPTDCYPADCLLPCSADNGGSSCSPAVEN